MCGAPFKNSAPLGGRGVTLPPTPPWTQPLLKVWAQFSSGPSADQKISLVPSIANSFGPNIFFGASKNSVPPEGWTHPPTHPPPGAPPSPPPVAKGTHRHPSRSCTLAGSLQGASIVSIALRQPMTRPQGRWVRGLRGWGGGRGGGRLKPQKEGGSGKEAQMPEPLCKHSPLT